MEYFSHKSDCGLHVLRHLKEELAWTIDKWLQFISNVMLLTAVIPLIKLTKN